MCSGEGAAEITRDFSRSPLPLVTDRSLDFLSGVPMFQILTHDVLLDADYQWGFVGGWSLAPRSDVAELAL